VPSQPGGFAPQRERDAAGNVIGPGRAGWWNDAVFYEVFVRSFKDSASGPLAGDGIGDIPGLIEKLDYLNDGDPKTTTDLGVTGLWLMPINPSPSYHGYDITDYFGVNPPYGTMDDLKRLIAECHKRGIHVILDLVLNHCSDQNPWFDGAVNLSNPKHDWFIWSDTDPGWRGPWGQRVWHRTEAEGGVARWYYGLFSAKMPDLNYRTPAVSQEMLRVVDFWIDKSHGVGADGYRLDAVRHLIEDGQVQENTIETHEWLKKFHAECRKDNPGAMSIGEVWTSSETASTYVGDELDLTFEFDLAAAMTDAAKTGKARPVVEAQARVLRCYPPGQYGRFLSNHDQRRIMTSLGDDSAAMRSAAAMLLLGPGVPFIYYGEELGMTGDKPDERLRTPMQWTPEPGGGFTEGKPWETLAGDVFRRNVKTESSSESSLLTVYRDLIRLRTQTPALCTGGYWPVNCSNDGVYAFIRGDAPDAAVGEKDPARAEAERVSKGEGARLVLINLSGRVVRDYELHAPTSPIRGGFAGVDEITRPRPGAGAEPRPVSSIECVPDTGAFRGFAPVAALQSHEIAVFGFASAPGPRR
jgi:glycosidase